MIDITHDHEVLSNVFRKQNSGIGVGWNTRILHTKWPILNLTHGYYTPYVQSYHMYITHHMTTAHLWTMLHTNIGFSLMNRYYTRSWGLFKTLKKKTRWENPFSLSKWTRACRPLTGCSSCRIFHQLQSIPRINIWCNLLSQKYFSQCYPRMGACQFPCLHTQSSLEHSNP